jgi:hypothetical protein
VGGILGGLLLIAVSVFFCWFGRRSRATSEPPVVQRTVVPQEKSTVEVSGEGQPIGGGIRYPQAEDYPYPDPGQVMGGRLQTGY